MSKHLLSEKIVIMVNPEDLNKVKETLNTAEVQYSCEEFLSYAKIKSEVEYCIATNDRCEFIIKGKSEEEIIDIINDITDDLIDEDDIFISLHDSIIEHFNMLNNINTKSGQPIVPSRTAIVSDINEPLSLVYKEYLKDDESIQNIIMDKERR